MKQGVLILIERFGIGGIETHVGAIASSLGDQYDFYIAANNGTNIGYFKKLFKDVLLLSGNNLSENIDLLEKFLKDKNIQIVHVHQYGVFHEAIYVALTHKIRLFVTNHGYLYPIDSWREELGNSRLVFWSNYVFKLADGVSAVSSKQKEFWQKEFPILKNKIVVTHNCVNVDDYKTTEVFSNQRFLMTVRLDGDKLPLIEGAVKFIDSLRAFPGFESSTLVIAGSGAESSMLKEKYKTCEHINFIGEYDDISDELSKSFALIGTGRSALEAIAAKRHVILSGLFGFHGFLTDEKLKLGMLANLTGKNLESEDVTKAAKEFASLSSLQREEVINKCYKIVRDDYGINRIRSEINKLYCVKMSAYPQSSDIMKDYLSTERLAFECRMRLFETEAKSTREVEDCKYSLMMKERVLNDIIGSRSWKFLSKLRFLVYGKDR
ncbi:MAG: glycosyltransferase family 4 protein [Bacillota bacterium]|nr:glycosyltransferase family 4 protein [Bacillota bacterium]